MFTRQRSCDAIRQAHEQQGIALTELSDPNGIDSCVVFEEVRGPIFGYYVAGYAVATHLGYFAYAKVCEDRPSSVWDTPSAVAKMAIGPLQDAERLMDRVFYAVYRRLERRLEAQTTDPDSLAKK
jgi:hypothetical protein